MFRRFSFRRNRSASPGRSRGSSFLSSFRRGRSSSGGNAGWSSWSMGSSRPRFDERLWGGDNNPAVRVHEKPKEDAGAILTPSLVDLLKGPNRSAHRTEEYEQPDLIVRRGQPFDISITFGKEVDQEKDKIKLQFATGNKPQQSKGTLIRLQNSDTLSPSEWGAKITEIQNKNVTLRVIPAADAIVGKYSLFVETYQEDEKGEVTQHHRYKHDEDIYILFNAWCEDDVVYLAAEDEIREYILNESGRIWIGDKLSTFPLIWSYSQFEDVCLKAALYILENSYLKKEFHGNPIEVIRVLSAMGNSKDNDNGILVGNWTDNFRGGTPPERWHDTAIILQEYMRYKRPVKFGQCWVFGALLTTLGRTLGIPTRCVTCYYAGIDKDASMTIDIHLADDGTVLSHMSDDFWNYHVWNESWFARHDLPKGNDGWQAFDATPQMDSEGLKRCGPSPVNAIKEGNVYLGYDTMFMFASVNGDLVKWIMNKSTGEMEVYEVDLHKAGQDINTKAVGSNSLENITDQYKYREGTEEERQAVEKATLQSNRREKLQKFKLYKKPEHDTTFEIEQSTSSRGDMTFTLNAKNGSASTRSVSVRMQAVAKYYTGVTGNKIAEHKDSITLDGNGENHVTWNLGVQEYLTKLTRDGIIGVYVTSQVEETNQIYWTGVSYMVTKPTLQLNISPSSVKVGEEFDVEITFQNPLGVTLTGGHILLEGAGLQRKSKISLRQPITPEQEVKTTVRLKARRKGKREVIASLSCKELSGIDGSSEVEVTE